MEDSNDSPYEDESHDDIIAPLQSKSTNTVKPPETNWSLSRPRRIYSTNELLRLGAVANNQALRRIRSVQNNLYQPHWQGSRTLRKSTSAYNGLYRDPSKLRDDSNATNVPSRQPNNPDGDFDWQKARGFARFIKEHASPRHHRVTAGGRIVPAAPNTPPPTFHDAFLEAFLKTEGAGQDAERRASVSSQNDGAVHQHLVPTPLPLNHSGIHPNLKVPPGFHVMQVSVGGTVATVIRGSTIYRCELMPNGETNFKVASHEAVLHNHQVQTQNHQPHIHNHQAQIQNHQAQIQHRQPTAMLYDSAMPPQIPDVMQPQLAGMTPVYPYQPRLHHPVPLQQYSWNQIEQQLHPKQDAQPMHLTDSYFTHQQPMANTSMGSIPGNHVGSYQQQLSSLEEAIQEWTAMLMDAERVLCFPKVLGPVGVEQTQMKKQVVMVKINELTRKKQQLLSQMGTYPQDPSPTTDSESGYQDSSRAPTEYGNGVSDQPRFYLGQYHGDATHETHGLSALAPSFIPQNHVGNTQALATIDPPQEAYHQTVSTHENPAVRTDVGQDATTFNMYGDGATETPTILSERIHRQLPSLGRDTKRTVTHTYGAAVPIVTWSRLPDESREQYHARCAEQRKKATRSKLASTSESNIVKGISPQKSLPTFRGLQFTAQGFVPAVRGPTRSNRLSRSKNSEIVV